MQGRAFNGQEGFAPRSIRLNTKFVAGITAMLGVVFASSVYAFWRVDLVQENAQLVNQFYVPALKYLNMIGGKWSAYQRAFEQAVAFRKWGKKSEITSPNLRLKKMVEGNVQDLAKLLDRASARPNITERAALQHWLERLTVVSNQEPSLMAEINGLVKTRRFAEAAALYAQARQENLAISQDLALLGRDVESRVSLLQLSIEQELRGSQSVMVLLLGITILFSLIMVFRLQRWLRPIASWTRVAQEIALKGLSRDIKFPKIVGTMPPEISLLTREFTRMGMTVLEREKTIRAQRDKVESLNNHLKDQNEILRRLGALNERVLNSMSSGLLVVGEDGVVEQFNERYCELFRTERGNVFHVSAKEVLSAWPSDLVSAWVDSVLESDRPLRFSRISLSGRVFDIRVQPLHAQGGRILLFDDVTQVVEAEERLEHARKLVLAGNLSSQVAHEVRNPLNSMSLQLEMLEEDLNDIPDPDARAAAADRLSAVSEQVQRLDRITRRYLDVGRTPLGPSQGLIKGEVDLHSVVERCLQFLGGEIQACEVAVEARLDAKNSVVTADPDALSQVVFNLVRNALDAMRDNPPNHEKVLRLYTRNAGHQICLNIQDTGPGIADSVRMRIFAPFVTTKASGHGLGLSLSRQVCIDHGGELRLGGEFHIDGISRGAAFEMAIPCAAN